MPVGLFILLLVIFSSGNVGVGVVPWLPLVLATLSLVPPSLAPLCERLRVQPSLAALWERLHGPQADRPWQGRWFSPGDVAFMPGPRSRVSGQSSSDGTGITLSNVVPSQGVHWDHPTQAFWQDSTTTRSAHDGSQSRSPEPGETGSPPRSPRGWSHEEDIDDDAPDMPLIGMAASSRKGQPLAVVGPSFSGPLHFLFCPPVSGLRTSFFCLLATPYSGRNAVPRLSPAKLTQPKCPQGL